MQKFNYLYLSVLLISSPVWSMKFSAPINRLKLPVMLSTEQPPAVKFTQPGDIMMSAVITCGDGDVANFAADYATFEYMPQDATEIDVVVGYWIVEDGATNDALLPTPTNWFPVAYKKLPITGTNNISYDGHFLPITHSKIASSINVMDLLKYDLINLHSLASSSFESDKSYRVMSAAFGCKDPDGASNLVAETSSDYTYKASSLEILRSLEVKLPDAVNNFFITADHNDLLNKSKLKIDLKSSEASRNVPSATPNPYTYDFGNHGINLEDKASQLYGIFKKIMNTDYPASAADLSAYKTDLIASADWNSAISGYASGDKIAFCNSVGASSHRTNKVYPKLEAFSMNLACKNLFSLGDLDSAYKALVNPDVKPTADSFKSLKKDLAKRFFVAASFEAAQDNLNDSVVSSVSGCFKKASQAHLMDRLILSYPFQFKADSTGKYVIKGQEHNAIHPENLFALQDYKRYFDNNEGLAIWGQVVPGQNLVKVDEIQKLNILLKLNDKTQLQNNTVEQGSFQNAININFMIRAIGKYKDRSCIWKC